MMIAEKDKEKKPFFIEFKNNYGTTIAKPSTTTTTPTIPSRKSSATVYYIHGLSRPTVKVGHCHRDRMEGIDKKARKKLIIASILCLLFMIAEIIGGILSNSLAIATDAAHLLTDFAAFMISLFALWLAGRPSTQRLSFGWYRAEVIGALVSVLLIWAITAILIWLAINRIINKDYELEAGIMLITSALAIVSNVIMGWQLHHGHGHSHGGGGGDSGSDDHHHHDEQEKQLAITNPSIGSTTSTATTVPAAAATAVETSTTEQPNSVVETNFSDKTITTTITAATIDPTNLPNNNEAEQKQNQQSTEQQQQQHNGHVNFEISENSDNANKSSVKKTKMTTENINVRAAFIHVVGDVVQSIGVFVAALVIYFKPEWAIVDPICTFVFSIIVLCTTFKILKDAILVLMEATPDYLHYAEVMNIFLQIDGVERVHNLRIWALSINKCALSAHLAIRPGANPRKILQDANTAVHLRYNFFETTIQIEDFTPEMEECKQCTIPGS